MYVNLCSQVFFLVCKKDTFWCLFWCLGWDSNQKPSFTLKLSFFDVGEPGLEPGTNCLRGNCSTD